MKTFARKFLSVTLAAMMLLSMLPTVAFAASETEDFLRIYHFDCGRKYFTVDEVKEIIDALAENYYTHLELAFGNDGLRLLLDDMSVTVGETEYSHDDVVAGIQAGNVAYSHSGEWNQAEMDEIMAYADDAGIKIIPLVNTPGHMDAIVDAMASVGIDANYGSSVRTVDVTNANGVAFTQALIAKYAAYFAEKGCTYFHMGADEYANDAYPSGSMGFGQLISAGQYDEYVSYINGVAQIIKDAGMIPMAFNDGIYFQSNTSNGTFDSDIVITYWSSGWSSYTPATASFLANKGHKIVNTNDGWYYVLGRNSGDTYSLTTARSNVAGTPVTDVPGNSDPTSIGAMMCLWCDTPSVSYDSNKSYVLELIETWATSNPDYFTEPQGPEMVEIAKNGVTVTAPGLTSLSVTEVEAPEISGANNILAWEIVPETEEDYYTDSAEVVVSVPSDWNTSNMRAFVVNDDDSITKIRGSYASGKYTFTMPHFSVGGIYDVEATAEDLEDSVSVSEGTTTSYVLDTDGSLDVNAQYLIVYKNSSSATTGYALNTSKDSVNVSINGSNATPASDASAALWTYTSSGNRRYLENGSDYLYPIREGSRGSYTYTLNISGTQTAIIIFSQGNGAYRIYDSSWNSCVTYSNGSWGAASSASSGTNLYFYKYTPGTQAYTVDAARQESRINSLTVSNEGYTDESWAAYESALAAAQNKLTAVESTKYTSENAANTAVDELIAVVDALEDAKDALKKARVITITYETEDGTVVGTGTMNVTEEKTTVTLPTSINGTDGNSYAPVDKTLSVPAGTYEFTVTVQDKAPDDAMTDSTLTVEYWITNFPVHVEASNSSAQSVDIDSDDATSVEGIEIAKVVAAEGYSGFDGWVHVYYWQSMRLDADNLQTEASGDDETADGTTFTHVRYYNGAWQYKNLDGKWNYFQSDDQAVAYYLQKTEVDTRVGVDIYSKDWGYTATTTKPDTASNSQVGLAVAVVYPDGSIFPAESDFISNSAVIFNWWENRDIGIVSPRNNSTYSISKMTVTPGVYTGTKTNAGWWTSTEGNVFEWEMVTDEAGETWYNETTYWDAKTNAGTTPMVNGTVNQIIWESIDDAYLVLIYLVPTESEDNLTVKYVDDANGGTAFYDFQIAVSYTNEETPTTFFNGLVQTSTVPTEDGTLILDDDAYVTNSSNANQTINKKLSLLSGDIPAQYRTGIYDYVGAEIADNGKTLILHYTLNESKLSPLYVIDFGLPMNFNIADVIENPEQVNEVTIGQANYGTLTRSGNVFTYTPTSVLLDTDVVRLTFKLTNGNSISKNMGFTPASNVLYEDGFMSVGDESSSRYTWEDASKSSTNTSPSGKQTVDQAVQYGYDTAYTGVTGASGTQYTAEVTESMRYTNDLAFTFNGVGFDLIGACEANSGTLMVRLNDANGNYVKAYVVDTAFEDAAYNTIYQVPLIHEQELQSGTYTAVIRGAYITYNAAASSVETLSLFDGSDDTMAQIYDLMYEMGLSEEDLDTVEFISVNDMADEGILLLADDSETDGMSLAIDGFRVYRSTDNSVFMASEKGVTYTNVMAGTAGNIIAYIEGDGNETGDTSYAVSEYEKMGGPQNEIYLQPNTAIAIQLKDETTYAQISARAVGTTAANLSDGKSHSYNIAHNTELYYVVTAADDGLLVIGNTSGGLLALGNLKASCGITTINTGSLAAAEEAVLLMMSMPPVSDEPETPVVPEVPVEPIKPNKPSKPDKPNKPNKPGNKKEDMPELSTSFVGGNVFAFPWSNKVLMTVVVTSAEEIDYITINGREITGTGRYVDGSYVYVITDTFDGNGAIEYEVIAYSVTGKASATKVFSVK